MTVKAYKHFFKRIGGFPRFKKKRSQDVKAYFPKNNAADWTTERHRIKIPTLKFVRLKEKGYIPSNVKITSGTVSVKAGCYYVLVLVKESRQLTKTSAYSNGIALILVSKIL